MAAHDRARNRGRKSIRRVAAAAALALLSATASSAGALKPRTVVELFTSQGCSSCPPANANLIQIKDRPGVLALSYGVTYWDYLGWKDIFARPEFTTRQRSYEGPLGHSGPFTPQIVVNGGRDTVGNRIGQVTALIDEAGRARGPVITLDAGRLSIGAGEAGGRNDVWLVRYKPGVVEVPVARGENTGRTLPHGNVVHSLARIGHWSGAAATFSVPPEGGLKTAVLIQKPDGGPILAAAAD